MSEFADDPASFFGNDVAAAERLPRTELEALQGKALKERFASLRDRLPPLRALAEAEGIRDLETTDDVVPLLFPHSLYKSYAPQLLEQLRFDEMTRWVSRLTVCDLSPLIGEAFNSIDGWLDAMDSRTELRLLLSSGTTGGLSLVPRARPEHEAHGRHIGMVAAPFRSRAPNGNFQVIWPAYARGKQAALRSVDHIISHIAGGPERFHALIDAEMSADIQFYTSRTADRMKKGITGALPVYPHLRACLDKQQEMQRMIPELRRAFLNHIVEDLRGKQVDLFGGPVLLHQIASEALAEGHRGVFAQGSVITMFGGAKGLDLPEDWLEKILAFTGPVDRFITYGMTELTCDAMLCEEGRFHCASTTIPYVLDEATGAPLPRSGVQTGRAAFFDLLPRSSWGGIMTSDLVEINWSPCPCGRTAPHFGQDITRLDDALGDEWAIRAHDYAARRAAFDSLNLGLA